MPPNRTATVRGLVPDSGDRAEQAQQQPGLVVTANWGPPRASPGGSFLCTVRLYRPGSTSSAGSCPTPAADAGASCARGRMRRATSGATMSPERGCGAPFDASWRRSCAPWTPAAHRRR